MSTFQHKVVAITGAGSGIGRATACLLAGQGARLAISDVNLQGLEETQSLCSNIGAEVFATKLDVADRADVYAWAEATFNRFGKVNVIINNAGVSLGATVEDLGYEDFEWLMNINFWGLYTAPKPSCHICGKAVTATW
nr:SDR family NAD(P)-dependent oxidoreductase [Oleomonas cavernae]